MIGLINKCRTNFLEWKHMGPKIKVGDMVYPKKGRNSMEEYFDYKPQKVIKVEKTPRLSYCGSFIHVTGTTQGFYNTALDVVV